MYRSELPANYYIDVNSVNELKGYTVSDTLLTLGANMTLAQLIDVFQTIATNLPSHYQYMKKLADHVELVANKSIRNVSFIRFLFCLFF